MKKKHDGLAHLSMETPHVLKELLRSKEVGERHNPSLVSKCELMIYGW